MKALVRNTIFYALGLHYLAVLLAGVTISGGLVTLLIGGFILSLLLLILKPILNLLSFPLNFVSLGLYSALVNVIILYVLTLFVPNITITAFRFTGFTFLGFVIPSMWFNQFFAFVVAASVLAVIIGFIQWLIE